jgi:hypothetical protein
MSGGSMVERAMGERYAHLQPAVQRFHRYAGRVVLQGRVRTEAPSTWPAVVMALCLGTPRRATEGALRFELEAQPDAERWTRHFPERTMTSRMRLQGGLIEEQLGAARLRFVFAAADGALHMRLVSLRFFGVPCPRWLLPRVTAQETGMDDRLYFRVSAALPWIGTVASYSGHLVLVAQKAT